MHLIKGNSAARKFSFAFAAAPLLFFVFAQGVPAQQTGKQAQSPAKSSAKAKPSPKPVPKEQSSVTQHTIRINGQTISYTATASTTLLRNDKGEPTALMYSTAYTKNGVKDMSHRPIAFLYNGGPGSSSVWLHMGAFGPRRVVTDNASATPPAPYRIVDNAYSLLDKADLVFIDPVGTGFSHAVGKAKDKDFWGVDSDVRSIAQFISIYVSHNNRWNSPKLLIGESYGTFRSVALANYLQSHDGMYINGMVLLSSVLDFDTLDFSTGEDLSYILYLPTYAAVAWHYNLLKNRPADLSAFLDRVRQFASTQYADALMQGSNLSDAQKEAVAKKMAALTGLDTDYLVKADLRVNLPMFRAELLRRRGLTVGRYDGRFSGATYDVLEEYARYDPSYSAVVGAFTAAFNTYVRQELKFGQGMTYKILPSTPSENWNWKKATRHGVGFPAAPNVENDLIRELTANPHLQVQVENGYFDLATPFFGTEYTMDHLLLPKEARNRIHLDYYDAGHMIYLHEPDLAKLKANVARFIDLVSR